MPAAIVSMVFFNPKVARSTMEQNISVFTTTYYDDVGTYIGKSITEQNISVFNTRFYGPDKAYLGSATTHQNISFYNSDYFDANNVKIGSAKAKQISSDYTASYYNLSGQEIATSYTEQVSSYFKSEYFRKDPNNTNKASSNNTATPTPISSTSSPTLYGKPVKAKKVAPKMSDVEVEAANTAGQNKKSRCCSIM